MKRNIFKFRNRMFPWLIPVVFIFITVGCSSRLTGTYVSERNANQYLELKSDGTFFLKENMQVHGKYEVEGNEITLKTDIGFATKGKIEGNILTDDDGVKWIKK